MPRNNPVNPHSVDPAHRQKDVAMPVQKAHVLDARGMPEEDGYHSVKIRVYGDDAPYVAPVLAPIPGCVWVPPEGTDVAVVFADNDKPWVIGSWYAADAVQNGAIDLPDYEPGDIRIGNQTGSHVAVKDDGSIEVVTNSTEPIEIDHNSGNVFLSADQSIPGDNTFTKVTFDTVGANTEDLFDTTDNSFTIRHGGEYKIYSSVEFPNAGQNNLYRLGIFRNGSLEKRFDQQSAKNAPISLGVQTQRQFDAGDTFDVRVRQDSGSSKTLASDNTVTEFYLQRIGI